MSNRSLWIQKVEEALQTRNVTWVAGVRRVGKTTLCSSLPGARLFDCELPRVRAELGDAEVFFRRQPEEGTIVLDEVHRLLNPSEVLKIAADHFPDRKVVATGSSTLAARRKFKDSLAGRKNEVWLVPTLAQELPSFLPGLSQEDALERRMLRGGLPPFLLAPALEDSHYLEWLESFWAKDVQELFVIEKKRAFQTFIELLFRQSGELFEATAFAGPCEVSRQTIVSYLDILETTLLATALRPFAGGSASELRAQPKVYAFDTGFVAWMKGWDTLAPEAKGLLLEHLVLESVLARWPRALLHYWRNKAKLEVDFVLKPGRTQAVHAIECKSRMEKFDPAGIRAFRRLYPEGNDVLVTLDATRVERRVLAGHPVVVTPVAQLHEALTSPHGSDHL